MAKPKPLPAIVNLSKFIHDQTVVLLDKLNAQDEPRLDALIARYEDLESLTQQLFVDTQAVVEQILSAPQDAPERLDGDVI